MKYLNNFVLAVLAGASISIGGAVFLSLDNKVLGAVFFCVGLFMVCTLGLNLFTGKVCALPNQPTPAYLGFLGLVWLGNLTGAELTALLLRATRVGAAMAATPSPPCSSWASSATSSSIWRWRATRRTPTPSASTWASCSG